MSNRWIAPVVIGGIMDFTTNGTVRNYTANKIPKVNEVQQGYVVPSKLEIELQDLDGNGKKEVLMNYKGTRYLLTLDELGRPRVQAYEIKPVEVILQ